ncbi:hypothetical protein [Pedobacter alpinus]|uniref:Uncharacterized protein n=1 Tax=Pedobacter alpinus TaxID=1590643 RepID=A0ABW5TP44_9SPHI
MKTEDKRLIVFLLGANGLLLIPLVAMQFTTEVNWDFTDFTVMAILLSGTALLCEMILRIVKQNKFRVMLCIVVVFVFLLIWAELAVGIFNTPLAGN